MSNFLKGIALTWGLGLVSGVVFAKNLSLSEALDLAAKNSADVASSERDIEIQEHKADVANAGAWPKLSASARMSALHSENGFDKPAIFGPLEGESVKDTITYDVVMTYPIYSGGLVSARRDIGTAQKKVAQAKFEKTLRNTRAKVIESYFLIAAYREKAHYFSSLVSFINSVLNRVRGGVSGGAFSRNEKLSLQATLNGLRQRRTDAEFRLGQVSRLLRRQIGLDERVPLTLTDGVRLEKRAPMSSELVDSIVVNDPGKRALVFQGEVVDGERAKDLSWEYPKLNLEGRYGSFTRYAGIGLSIPIFNGFSYFAKRGVWAQQKAKLAIESKKYDGETRDMITARIDSLNLAVRQLEEIAPSAKEFQANWKRVNANFKLSGAELLVWKGTLEELVRMETLVIDQLAIYRSNSEILKDWMDPR